jgi:DNA ligase (NAD+)
MDEMRRLVDLLNKYAYEYYVLDEPTVADKQYDALYDKLVILERETGVVLPDSPTRRVGGEPIKEFGKHEHIKRLYSLDKCQSFAELSAWDAKLRALAPEVEYTVEYKLDGLTLCLTYEDGEFKGAATRGNGETGEDVTQQVLTIKSIPLRIECKELIEVQGEGIMRLSALKKYNETAAEPLKNARNGVAGAIRNLDPKVTAARNLDVIFYNVNYLDKTKLSSQEENIAFLKRNKFKTEKLFVSRSMDEIIDYISKVKRDELDFLIDGMVIKVNDLSLRDRLGYTDKFPRWAMAYKFEAEETTAKLLDVTWNVGRTGKLTPLAFLEPTELCGVTVRKATLNNYGDILRKKVKINSNVFIRRSNDVIPEILGIAEDFDDSREIIPPEVCPACGSVLYVDGANIFCPNERGCRPQIIGRLEHFSSKECMDIRGVSESTLAQIVDKFGLVEPYELYYLTPEQLLSLDGFKDKKTDNFFASLSASKSADLPHFLNALGIENVGKVAAKDLAVIYGSIGALSKATAEELAVIDNIGLITAEGIVKFFATHGDVIDEYAKIGISPTMAKPEAKDGAFKGLKVVLTGSLSSYSRSEAAKKIEEKGGEIQSSVTKSTNLVVCGENAGSKLDKARSMGVKVIFEEEFLKMLDKTD